MQTATATESSCAGVAHNRDRTGELRAERERLTQLLRTLAADLDALDRRLSNLAWLRHRGRPARPGTDPDTERDDLERRRDLLGSRLSLLAAQLGDLDRDLSALPGEGVRRRVTVGTCPDCGYPSLESHLCATCRRYLAGSDASPGSIRR